MAFVFLGFRILRRSGAVLKEEIVDFIVEKGLKILGAFTSSLVEILVNFRSGICLPRV